MPSSQRLAIALAIPLVAGLALVAARSMRAAATPRVLEGPAATSAGVRREETTEFEPNEPEGETFERRGADPTAREALSPGVLPGTESAPVRGRAPIGGMVVDQRRNPLAHCKVTVLPVDSTGLVADASNALSDEVDTDERGLFRTRVEFPPGRYRLVVDYDDCPRDDELAIEEARALVVSPDERSPSREDLLEATRSRTVAVFPHLQPLPIERATISLSKGPRYEIAAALPAGYGPCDFLGSIVCASDGRRAREEARLAGDARLRLRFDHTIGGCAPPWTLRLASEDGWWSGVAEVDSIEGECASAVRIDLRPRARIAGTVRGPSGRSLAGVHIVFASGAGEDVRATSDERGDFEFGDLPAGPGRLRASAKLYVAAERALELVALREERVVLALDELPHGDVEGVLRVRSGVLAPVPRLTLRPVGASEVEPERASLFPVDETAARFLFHDVPAGEYELRLEPLDGRRWSDTKRRVHAPAAGIELLRLDDELPMLVLDVVDARDGSRVPRPYARLEEAGETRWVEGSAGTLLVDPVTPETGPIATLCARGFRPAQLRIDALPRNGRFRSARVELHAGWGLTVRALDPESGEPLQGARILLDGREAGTTGIDGRALVSADREPNSIELELAGFGLREETRALPDRELVLRPRRTE